MESLACSVLKENLEHLKACGVDPARLAWIFRSAGIGEQYVKKTLNKDLPASERWGDFLSAIMENSKEGLFQKFIDVLLQERELEELGKTMKGNADYIYYYNTQCIWDHLQFL